MNRAVARGNRFLFTLALGASLLIPVRGLAALDLPQANGTTLHIEQAAQGLVTLAPHLAELAFAAGAGDRLLATAEYSNYPAAAQALPRIGDAFRFDLERILALKPDLVIAWESGNPPAALARLESLGLTVWRTEIHSPEDIADLIDWIARAAGLAPPAAARNVRDEIAALRGEYAHKAVLRYFYQVAEQPLFTLNGRHLVSQGLEICGALNIFAEEAVLAPQVSREAVLLANPDVLIAPALPDQADPLAHWRDWPRLDAVRHEAFILLPADEISRATDRTLNSFESACRQLDALRARIFEEPDS